MPILLSLISSGAIKWLSILILVFGLIAGVYSKHRQIVDFEKQAALQEYNIRQLEQNVKDKELFIKQMEEINLHKSEIISELYRSIDDLESKTKEVEIIIEKNKAQGNDRESSKVLKDTFKELEKLQ